MVNFWYNLCFWASNSNRAAVLAPGIKYEHMSIGFLVANATFFLSLSLSVFTI